MLDSYRYEWTGKVYGLNLFLIATIENEGKPKPKRKKLDGIHVPLQPWSGQTEQVYLDYIACCLLPHFLTLQEACFFPTCQVRVVRFYQSCSPPPPRPPPPRSPDPSGRSCGPCRFCTGSHRESTRNEWSSWKLPGRTCGKSHEGTRPRLVSLPASQRKQDAPLDHPPLPHRSRGQRCTWSWSSMPCRPARREKLCALELHGFSRVSISASPKRGCSGFGTSAWASFAPPWAPLLPSDVQSRLVGVEQEHGSPWTGRFFWSRGTVCGGTSGVHGDNLTWRERWNSNDHSRPVSSAPQPCCRARSTPSLGPTWTWRCRTPEIAAHALRQRPSASASA